MPTPLSRLLQASCQWLVQLCLAGWLGLVAGQSAAPMVVAQDRAAGAARPDQAAIDLRLALPIDCTLGRNCHILAYVDHLPGPAFQDFGGGRQTYDGHDGTDFGIASEAAMREGVAVLAAAAGVVVRVRDGMADKRVASPEQVAAMTPIGCGNGVVIDHGNQVRTLYCHLRQGSVAVQPGRRVEKGAALGMVGSSGLASFPHLHFGVLLKGASIDPFRGWAAPTGSQEPGAAQPVWEVPINYVPTGLIGAGFSDRPVDIRHVWSGASSPRELDADAPALVFWAHPFGVLAGDVEHIRLIAPGGNTAAENARVLGSPNRINRVSLIGQRKTSGRPFAVGAWAGHYQLRRNERLLIDITREIDVVHR